MLCRLLIGMVSVSLFASAATAAELDAVSSTLAARTVSETVVRLIAEQQTLTSKPAGFDEWSARMERARVGRENGKKLVIVGGAMVGAGVLLNVWERWRARRFGGDSPGEYDFLSAIGIIAGSGVAGYGGYRLAKAGGEIGDLEREGRTKGYLTLSPLPEIGVRLAVNLTF